MKYQEAIEVINQDCSGPIRVAANNCIVNAYSVRKSLWQQVYRHKNAEKAEVYLNHLTKEIEIIKPYYDHIVATFVPSTRVCLADIKRFIRS